MGSEAGNLSGEIPPGVGVERIINSDPIFRIFLYTHELLESEFMGSGMGYDAAHAAALDQAGVSPFSLYHPDVIQQFPEYFNSNWRAYWGLK